MKKLAGTVIGRSTLLGGLAGLVLAGGYGAVMLAMFSLVATTGLMADGGGLLALPLMGGIAFCGGLLSIFLGLLPGILLGLLGGFLTGILVRLLPPLPPAAAWLPGALIGLATAVGLHFLLGPGFLADAAAGRSTLLPYFFWVIGPGLLAVAGLGWVSAKARQPGAFLKPEDSR